MTRARDWPNNAASARDTAAEEIAAALRYTVALLKNGGQITNEDKYRTLSLIINHLQNALRWLESAGAQTRPPET